MCEKGIIFDLDGTLWETTDATYKSVNEICKKHNLKEISAETICKVFGKNRQESAKMYFPYMNLEDAEKLLDEISNINIKNLTKYGGNLYGGLENVLIKLKKEYRLFIVSNSDHEEYIASFLKSAKLTKYFDDYIAASQIGITKGKAIRLIIVKYCLNKAIYVGDTEIDLKASEFAKIPFIYVKYGFGGELNTQYFIDEIQDLPAKIKEIIQYYVLIQVIKSRYENITNDKLYIVKMK